MLASWVLSLMLLMQPQAPWMSSYEATARAIDEVVASEPPLFGDDAEARSKTAALLVTLAWFESTFRPDAVGHGGVRGLYQTGGHGRLAEPVEATRVALTMMRESFRLCAARPVAERLAQYAQGGTSCKAPSTEALKKSRARVGRALWLVRRAPPPP